MTKVKSGDTVNVHYTGKLEDGTVFDNSVGRDPLQFTVGNGQVIPGFEQAVVGMSGGESKTIKIPADEAYGPHREDMILVIERSRFPADLKLEIGQHLQMRHADGRDDVVTVTAASESDVTLDANHPLAGKELAFDIRLAEIV